MRKFHVKKGDEAVVIAGAEKGKRGKIISVIPKKQRVILEGARMIKKHMRKSQDSPQGAIIEREGTIHISNPDTTVPIHGTVNGAAITFGTVGSTSITYTGSVSGSSMSGNYKVGTANGSAGGPWSAAKKS